MDDLRCSVSSQTTSACYKSLQEVQNGELLNHVNVLRNKLKVHLDWSLVWKKWRFFLGFFKDELFVREDAWFKVKQ